MHNIFILTILYNFYFTPFYKVSLRSCIYVNWKIKLDFIIIIIITIIIIIIIVVVVVVVVDVVVVIIITITCIIIQSMLKRASLKNQLSVMKQ